jgi:hypothetical protein
MMSLVYVVSLAFTCCIFCALVARHHLRLKCSAARSRIAALFLRTTRITVDASQFGHAIPVNDHLQLLRHASGRTVCLLVPRPQRQRPPMPRLVRAVLLTFFTL